jgi:hypothetical protein
MSPESLEMEPLTEKLLKRSLDGSFSDADENEDDDIVVHESDDGPSNEDRKLLDEEDEREKLLSKKTGRFFWGRNKHSRQKSTESYMEDGVLRRQDKPRRSNVRQSFFP